MNVSIALLAAMLTLGVDDSAVTVVQPVPVSSPLKTIIRVKSSPVCTVLRENVGPAIAAMADSDQRYALDGLTMLIGAHDSSSASRTSLHIAALDEQSMHVARNIATIESLLADPKYASAAKLEPELNAIRESLEAAAARQKQALDIMTSLTETYHFDQLAAAGPQSPSESESNTKGHKSTQADHQIPLLSTPGSPTGQNFALILPQSDPRVAAAMKRLTYFDGASPLFGAAAALGAVELPEQDAEQQAARVIIPMTAQCH